MRADTSLQASDRAHLMLQLLPLVIQLSCSIPRRGPRAACSLDIGIYDARDLKRSFLCFSARAALYFVFVEQWRRARVIAN